MNYDLLEEAFQYVQSIFPKAKPTCGLILGSGWSEAVDTFDIEKTCYYEDVPGLGKTGVIGHAGRLAWGRIEGVETLIFQGRRHFYEGEGWTPIALPVYVLKKLGVETLVLTNAAGSCRIDLHPGHLMVLEDHINNFPDHPLIGPHNEVWGARFPDQSKVYDRELIRLFQEAANEIKIELAKGVYLASSGPTYETPAEVRAFKGWGADAVGMSTIPEALLGSAAGLRIAALSCISNFASGITDRPLSHEEVTDMTSQTMPKMQALLQAFFGLLNAS